MSINKNTKFGISACEASSGFKKVSGVGFSVNDFSLNKNVGSSMSINNKDKTIKERFDAWHEEGKSIARAISGSDSWDIGSHDMLETITCGIDVLVDDIPSKAEICATMKSRAEADLYDEDDDNDR